MARGGLGQVKSGERECKVCAHPGRTQIDFQLLNEVPYATIISQSARDFVGSVELTKPNLSTHKKNHLLTQPITRVVTGEDGQPTAIQTYLTGSFESQSIVIPQAAIPEIPGLTEGLKIIIAAGLQNVLHNPGIVTVDKLIAAMELYRKIGGAGANEMETLMGSWSEVEKRKGEMKQTAKRTRRRVTVEETTEETTARPASAPAVDVIEAEWSAADLESLALPAPGGTE